MAVTLKTIAEMAGVSRGTVDRVLNNRGKVSPEVEKRVRQVAQTLDYQPNTAGRMMAALRTRTKFGFILPGNENVFFIDLVDGIEKAHEELADMGVEVVHKKIDRYDVDAYLKLIDDIMAEDITGLALFPLDDERIAKRIDEIVESGIPVITINSDIKNSKRNCHIGVDFVTSGRLAAGLLGMINTTAKVLILGGSNKLLSHNQRIQGFSKTIAANYSGITIARSLECDDNNFRAYDLVLAALEEDESIDAVFVVGGGVRGACEALEKFPAREVKVLCFDDVPHVRELMARGKVCATVCQQPFEQGYTAMNRMFKFFTETTRTEDETILLDCIIKIRESFQA